jgi:hypothetical protein
VVISFLLAVVPDAFGDILLYGDVRIGATAWIGTLSLAHTRQSLNLRSNFLINAFTLVLNLATGKMSPATYEFTALDGDFRLELATWRVRKQLH